MNYFSQYGKGKEVRIYGLGKLLIDRLMQSHHFVDKEVDKRDLKALFHNSRAVFPESDDDRDILPYRICGFGGNDHLRQYVTVCSESHPFY